MALNTTKITELSETQLSDAEAFLVEFIQTQLPELSVDLAPGTALREYVVKLCATYYAINQEDLRRITDSNSLKKVTEEPELADEEVLDNLASNYLIERKASARASGSARVILNAKKFTAISTNLVFTSSGVNFRATRNFSGVVSSADVLDTGTKLIQPYGTGLYSFIIELVADTEGSIGNITKNALFTLSSGQGHIVSTVAETNFDGGRDSETNAELIGRLAGGISTKNLGSHRAAKAMVLEGFPNIVDISVIGAGDKEMIRDNDNLFGISVGGKSDIIVRSRHEPQYKAITVEGVLSDASLGTWSIAIPRDTAPGLYRVVSATDPDNNPVEVLTLSRSTDTAEIPGIDFTPHLPTASCGAFSRYQTVFLTVKAMNAAAGKTVGDKVDFTLSVLYPAQIDEVSDFVLDRDNRNPGGDYLVRGSTPCEVAVEIKITKGPGDPEVDTSVVSAAVSEAINKLQFVDGRLGADLVAQIVRNNVGARTVVNLPVTMTGTVTTWQADNDFSSIDTDGTLRLIGTNELVVPDRPDLGVTRKTVSFLCAPSSISVQVLSPTN